jgi:hypothetical protein
MSTENQSTEPAPEQAISTSLPIPTSTRIELSEGKASISLAPVGSYDTDPFVAQDLPRSLADIIQPVAQSTQTAPVDNATSAQTNSAVTQPAKG